MPRDLIKSTVINISKSDFFPTFPKCYSKQLYPILSKICMSSMTNFPLYQSYIVYYKIIKLLYTNKKISKSLSRNLTNTLIYSLILYENFCSPMYLIPDKSTTPLNRSIHFSIRTTHSLHRNTMLLYLVCGYTLPSDINSMFSIIHKSIN